MITLNSTCQPILSLSLITANAAASSENIKLHCVGAPLCDTSHKCRRNRVLLSYQRHADRKSWKKGATDEG